MQQSSFTQPLPERSLVTPALQRWLAHAPFLLFFVWMILKQRFALSATGLAPGPYMLWASVGSLLVLLPWLRLARGRLQMLGLLVADGLLTLLVYSDVLYFRQFGDLVSAATFRFAGQLGSVAGSVAALVEPRDLRLWLDLPLLALAAMFPSSTAGSWMPRIRLRTALLVSLGGALLILAFFLADPVISQKYYGHSMVGSRMGLINYHAFDTGAYVGRLAARATPSSGAVAEIREWFDTRRSGSSTPPPFFGAARGKNVIVLQVESLQAFPLDLRVGGQEVTPNLNRLARDSLRFTQFFTQTGQGVTSDADLLANCSLYPTRTGAVYYDYATNDFHCMPTVLREHGYTAIAAQGMPPDFWNLASVYPRIGFERYYSIKDHVMDEKLGIGLSDESFLRQSAVRLKELPEPYYAFLVTLTSHGPFDFEGMPHLLQLGDLEGTTAGHYLHAVHYTDKAIGQFLERLQADGILDRSVLVLYGDHAGVFRRSTGMSDLLGMAADDWQGWFLAEKRIPFLVRLPGGAHAGERNGVAGQVDIAPTLAALLGIKTEGDYFMGRDLLDPNRSGAVAFYDGSALNDARVYIEPNICFDRKSGEVQDLTACDGLAEQARRELGLSRQIVERNLIPLLRETK